MIHIAFIRINVLSCVPGSHSQNRFKLFSHMYTCSNSGIALQSRTMTSPNGIFRHHYREFSGNHPVTGRVTVRSCDSENRTEVYRIKVNHFPVFAPSLERSQTTSICGLCPNRFETFLKVNLVWTEVCAIDSKPIQIGFVRRRENGTKLGWIKYQIRWGFQSSHIFVDNCGEGRISYSMAVFR